LTEKNQYLYFKSYHRNHEIFSFYAFRSTNTSSNRDLPWIRSYIFINSIESHVVIPQWQISTWIITQRLQTTVRRKKTCFVLDSIFN